MRRTSFAQPLIAPLRSVPGLCAGCFFNAGALSGMTGAALCPLLERALADDAADHRAFSCAEFLADGDDEPTSSLN